MKYNISGTWVGEGCGGKGSIRTGKNGTQRRFGAGRTRLTCQEVPKVWTGLGATSESELSKINPAGIEGHKSGTVAGLQKKGNQKVT